MTRGRRWRVGPRSHSFIWAVTGGTHTEAQASPATLEKDTGRTSFRFSVQLAGLLYLLLPTGSRGLSSVPPVPCLLLTAGLGASERLTCLFYRTPVSCTARGHLPFEEDSPRFPEETQPLSSFPLGPKNRNKEVTAVIFIQNCCHRETAKITSVTPSRHARHAWQRAAVSPTSRGSKVMTAKASDSAVTSIGHQKLTCPRMYLGQAMLVLMYRFREKKKKKSPSFLRDVC